MYAKYEVRGSEPGLKEQSKCVKKGGCAEEKKCMLQAATAEMAFGCKKGN